VGLCLPSKLALVNKYSYTAICINFAFLQQESNIDFRCLNMSPHNTLKSAFLLMCLQLISCIAYANGLELYTPNSMCWTGERIFVADGGDLTVKEIKINGQVIASYGGKGRGPGEYLSLGNLHCGKSGVYAPDSQLRRITYYPYDNMEKSSTFAINDAINRGTIIKECGELICISGYSLNTLKTLHLYTKQFEYIRSIGDDLLFQNAKPDIERARQQFAHTEYVVIDNQTIVIFRPAPFEIGIIKDPFGKALFSKVERHDLIPKPWETEFVVIENNTYAVGLYPRAHSAYSDANNRIIILLYENNTHTICEYVLSTGAILKKGSFKASYIILSNLVYQNGLSTYLIYNPDTETIQKRIF